MATYIITGGASGIGAATRQVLIDQGDTVITVDIKDANICADLSDPEARDAAIAKIRSDHPRIDGIVTCAGVASHFPDFKKILTPLFLVYLNKV